MQDNRDHTWLHTPTSQNIPLHNAEGIKVNSMPPIVVNIRPVIESSTSTEHTYGAFADLSPTMSTAVKQSLKAFGSFGRFATLSKTGDHRCTERLLAERRAFWTLENPGHYACKTCFNRKQPCMRSIGNHQWIVLPLPPRFRGPGVVWQDKAYYIYPYEGNSMKYSGIWKVEPHKERTMKRERERAAAQQALAESPPAI